MRKYLRPWLACLLKAAPKTTVAVHLQGHLQGHLLGHSNHDITAAPVVDVVGKGAQGADDLFRVPSSLELDPLGFNGAAVDQVVYVDGQGHIWFLAVCCDYGVVRMNIYWSLRRLNKRQQLPFIEFQR